MYAVLVKIVNNRILSNNYCLFCCFRSFARCISNLAVSILNHPIRLHTFCFHLAYRNNLRKIVNLFIFESTYSK